MNLLKQQHNELLEIILEVGMNPGEFTEVSNSVKLYYIKYGDVHNQFEFTLKSKINHGKASYEVGMRPGRSSNPDYYVGEVASWISVKINFQSWLNSIKQELETTDLWPQVTNVVQLFEATSTLSTEKFSFAELGALHGQLRMLGQFISKSELLKEHKDKFEELLQMAAVKAEIFTKQDWQHWTKGVFINAIISFKLSEVQAQELLALVRLAFGGLFLK